MPQMSPLLRRRAIADPGNPALKTTGLSCRLNCDRTVVSSLRCRKNPIL
jgi:hypothetical protein